MPSFSPDVDDIYVNPDKYMGACNVREIKDVIEWLHEMGYIRKEDSAPGGKIGLSESTFQEYIYAIRDNYFQLTNEEEKIIINIGKKFKI